MLDLTNARTDAIDALHAATAIYTRSPVVQGLLDRIDWPDAPGLLADPSCGDGAFLIEALRRLKPAAGDAATAARVVGWELHPGACASARAAVREFLEGSRWSAPDALHAATKMVIEADFLVEPPAPGSIAFLVGNPPFLRWSGIPEQLRADYRVHVQDHARADMLHAFLDACDKAMAEDGAIALVTADRWLFNATTAALRERLGARNGLSHLARLDAGTSFHRPKFRRVGTPPRVHPVAIVMRRMAAGMRSIGRAPTYPPEANDTGEDTEDEGDTVALSSIATVRLAPWIGPRGIFHISFAEAAALGIGPEHLATVIDTGDLPADRDELRAPTTAVIRTARSREPTGAVRDHLLATVGRMPERGKRVSWWLPPEPLSSRPMVDEILIPRIANRLRAVPIAAGLMAVNHNFMVASELAGMTRDRLITILRHPDVQRDAMSRAPRLEGGYLDFRTGFVRGIRIPRRLLPTAA